MLFSIMSNVSQRFARVPTPRKEVFNNFIFAPKDAVIRSGPYVIPKLDDTQLNSTAEDKIVALAASRMKYSKPVLSHVLPLTGTTIKSADSPIPDISPNHPRISPTNHYAPKDHFARQPGVEKTHEENMNTINFYIKELENIRPLVEADKRYKSVDSMYNALRAKILDYIKSKDGIVKRDDLMSINGMKGKLDVPFQKILDNTEDFLSSVVIEKVNKNLSKLDIDQTASLVEENESHNKMGADRSQAGYNDTVYNDESEEDSPETQELVESLNHLPLGGEGFYTPSGPSSTANSETKTHRFSEHKRYTKDKDERLWAPKKKSNTLLSDNLVEKVTEVNYDPVELGDQELSDGEITESGDDAPMPSDIIKGVSNVQDIKMEKAGMDDEALNKKIDQRICNALDLFRIAMACGGSVSETIVTSSPHETSAETSTLDSTVVSSEQPVDEELTCVDTTCPSSSSGTGSKMTTKEHTLTTSAHVSKKTSTQQSIRKTIKPIVVESAVKSTKDIKKLNPTKSVSSKRTTLQKEGNRRNAIKFHMSQKRLKNTGGSDSDYEKVFGKHSRLLVSQKAMKAKGTKGAKVSKARHSKSG